MSLHQLHFKHHDLSNFTEQNNKSTISERIKKMKTKWGKNQKKVKTLYTFSNAEWKRKERSHNVHQMKEKLQTVSP